MADGYIDVAPAGDLELLGAALSFATGSATATNISVADATTQEYLAQDDAGSTWTVVGSLGLNANHLATAPTLLPVKSNHEIDISTVTTATAGFRLVGLVENPEYTVGDNAIWRCIVNEHHLNDAVGV